MDSSRSVKFIGRMVAMLLFGFAIAYGLGLTDYLKSSKPCQKTDTGPATVYRVPNASPEGTPTDDSPEPETKVIFATESTHSHAESPAVELPALSTDAPDFIEPSIISEPVVTDREEPLPLTGPVQNTDHAGQNNTMPEDNNGWVMPGTATEEERADDLVGKTASAEADEIEASLPDVSTEFNEPETSEQVQATPEKPDAYLEQHIVEYTPKYPTTGEQSQLAHPRGHGFADPTPVSHKQQETFQEPDPQQTPQENRFAYPTTGEPQARYREQPVEQSHERVARRPDYGFNGTSQQWPSPEADIAYPIEGRPRYYGEATPFRATQEESESLSDPSATNPGSDHASGFAMPEEEQTEYPQTETPDRHLPPMQQPRATIGFEPEQPAPITPQRESAGPVQQGPRPVRDYAMEAVNRRADESIRHAFALAARGARYSARAELQQVLRQLAQSNDTRHRTMTRVAALSEAFNALEEAKDFAIEDVRARKNVNVRAIAASHQTPILHEDKQDKSDEKRAQIQPLAALQQYFAFAQDRLAFAVGSSDPGSRALYGLGKIQIELASEPAETHSLDAPQAMVFYRAALASNPSNASAGNELGVLLARYGQWNEARTVLRQAVKANHSRATWENLATVHRRLGEHKAAELAIAQSKQLPSRTLAPNTQFVRWVDTNEFSRGNPYGGTVSRQAQSQPAKEVKKADAKTASKKEKSKSWFPWF